MKVNNIYTKLLKVQEEVGKIKKTEANPFFKSMYFDINGILAALKPTLNKLNLVLLQPLSHEGSYLLLETRLIDTETGEIISEKTILPDIPDAQKIGSAITYFRRYALQSFFALEAVDDDGNVASQPTGAKALPARKVYGSKPISLEQYQGKEVAKDSAEHDAGQTYEPIL